MEYISCFSGIGGLDGDYPPIGYSEIDKTCLTYLNKIYPKSKNLGDIKFADKMQCEVLTAGWPCQDISIAGKGRGLVGENSKLFYDMVNFAKKSNAHTVIAENVKNILRIDEGKVFKEILKVFKDAGFNFCSWRTLNSREFGLPHHRSRVFFIASKKQDVPLNIFRKIKSYNSTKTSKSYGFYWTAGTHSICYSKGYIPTLKLGGQFETPSSIAIHMEGKIKVLSGIESLKLQGFQPSNFLDIKNGKLVNLAGNAVSVPVGKFVFKSLFEKNNEKLTWSYQSRDMFQNDFLESIEKNPINGFFDGELHIPNLEKTENLASNLDDFLDGDFSKELSKRASSGLLRRLNLSKTFCPDDLRIRLEELA
jgi:DNA (cytosine-5)-methyltransferase 1